MLNKFTLGLVGGLMASAVAMGATQNNYCYKAGKNVNAAEARNAIHSQKCKNIPTNRRDELGKLVTGGNPVAVSLDNNTLYVHYTVGDSDKLQKCAVTTRVEDFKMSLNKNDYSTAYFIKDGHLLDVKMRGNVSKGACPKASTQDFSADLRLNYDDVVDFKIISDASSDITAIALTESGWIIYSTDSRFYKEFYGPFAKTFFATYGH
jgi:hypothetical protein